MITNTYSLAKFSLVFSVGIIVLMYFNYPFYNEKFSFLIFVMCFIIIIFSATKLQFGKDFKGETYEDAEEKFNKLHANDGQFKYTSKGFYFITKIDREHINYEDIILIQTNSIQLFDDTVETNLEIFTNSKNYVFKINTKDGYEKLVDQLIDNLSNWNFQEVSDQNKRDFVEKTILYEK